MKSGNFLKYVVSTEVLHLGGKVTLRLEKGDEVYFNGQVMKLGSDETNYPRLKGAIDEGWLVLSEEYDSDHIPNLGSARIKVRPADSTSPDNNKGSRVLTHARNEESSVGSIKSIRETARNRNSKLAAARNPPEEVEVSRPGAKIVSHLNDPLPEPVILRKASNKESVNVVRKLEKPSFRTEITPNTKVESEDFNAISGKKVRFE